MVLGTRVRKLVVAGLLGLGISVAGALARAEGTPDKPATNSAKKHWAYQKPVEPPVPSVKDAGWVKNPVDAFILAKLEEKGLRPAPPADKRTLIRRAYFDLIGVPPTPQDVEVFEADHSPDAFAKVVDTLLADPRYGERWGRYWLDVARYADTKGYVFQEERRYPYAYTYRDYVIRAFNEDLPYDRFLTEQIAADLLPLGDDKRPLAAMGFLTLGRRFLNAKPDIIDDRLDVICRGTMGVTIGCARCHDHKFDPIPTRDYYSLYAIFNNSNEPKDPPLIGEAVHDAAYEAFEKELKKREGELDKFLTDKHAELGTALRSSKQIADYLMAAQFQKPSDERDSGAADLSRFVIGRWKRYLEQAAQKHDAVFAAWRAYAEIPAADFAQKAPAVIEQFGQGEGKKPIHPLVLKAFAESPPASMREVAERYGKLIAEFDKPEPLADADQEALRQVIRASDAPANIQLADIDKVYKHDVRDKVTGFKRKIEELKATNPSAPPRAMALEDAKNIEPQRVFIRGNQGNPGDEVKPHFLTVLTGPESQPFTHGSGRLEFAQSIASKENPLTARVMVNRVWLRHFGFGIVRTPSDFGTRSDSPTHPELLDHLAVQFMANGWSIKKLHREMMLTSVYQQSSVATADASQRDAQNLFLSHMNRRRLDFEAVRDSLIAVTGKMDTKMGGKAVDITAEPFTHRRTVYAFIDRQNLPGLFRNFDFASPDTTSPQRFSTTVPQQALFMMNSPFAIQEAKALLERDEVKSEQDPAKRITQLYRILYNRNPIADEITLGTSFIAAEEGAGRDAVAWQYGYGEYDESAHRTRQFTPLTHFTGGAWQGGPTQPDPKTGWVTLTAAGGHPGNDAQHAAIRRWTAPADAAIRISGTLAHPETRGDGVRARIVCSRSGELASLVAFHGEAQSVLENVEVKKGDTIDFIVDCRDSVEFDSFTWAPILHVTSAPVVAGNDGPKEWNAATDFGGPEKSPRALSPWEKYAQVLLESNEFVFVD
ncbi:MAG: Protein of unknown function (DUF1553)/Protein of unknown function (DUF1549)/Planctomycete [Phycisphaerales bacterium]|nr:Protein of unknown function (DUF1553)/Protein of unknown function (DUF1549)/Planctomycete [Phycisphaerales bacterium]